MQQLLVCMQQKASFLAVFGSGNAESRSIQNQKKRCRGDDDSNSDSGGGDSDSGEINNNQLKAAVEKVATKAAAEARGERRQGRQERQASTRKCKPVPILSWSQDIITSKK
jgi:hypothetical protein